MTDNGMFWVFLSVVWVTTLAALGWMKWMASQAPHAEYKKEMESFRKEFAEVRTEVASLALAVGLRKREQGQGPFHPSMNVPPGSR